MQLHADIHTLQQAGIWKTAASNPGIGYFEVICCYTFCFIEIYNLFFLILILCQYMTQSCLPAVLTDVTD